MVRKKNRWLLVQFDFESDILSSCADLLGEAGGEPGTPASTGGGKKRRPRASGGGDADDATTTATSRSTIPQVTSADIYRSLRDSIVQNFGLAGAAAADVQVRVYDPAMRLAVVKTTRRGYPTVRSSLTVLTQIRQGVDVLRVVASTISVSGSARTARNAALGEIQKRFGKDVANMRKQNGDEPWTKKTRIALEKGLQELEGRLDKIDSGC
jgi:RNase P/RNase MRP subunit POP5